MDKFGSLFTNNGGRMLGLHDETVSFFTSYNMMSPKLKLTDGKELRDFLRMYGCDSIKRETGMFFKSQTTKLNVHFTINLSLLLVSSYFGKYLKFILVSGN